MDDPLIKLLLLIVPAVITVLVIVLSPMLQATKFKNSLIGEPICVIISRFDDDDNMIEVYRTEGLIDSIADGYLNIKRRTQPNFKIPFVPEHFLVPSTTNNNPETFESLHMVTSDADVDPNRGIISYGRDSEYLD